MPNTRCRKPFKYISNKYVISKRFFSQRKVLLRAPFNAPSSHFFRVRSLTTSSDNVISCSSTSTRKVLLLRVHTIYAIYLYFFGGTSTDAHYHVNLLSETRDMLNGPAKLASPRDVTINHLHVSRIIRRTADCLCDEREMAAYQQQHAFALRNSEQPLCMWIHLRHASYTPYPTL